jgi:DinB superfamily
MTKVELLTELHATRAEWETLLTELISTQLSQSNTVDDWSIKDVIFHCTRYANVYVQALQAAMNHEPPPAEVLDRTPIDERNQLDFQASQQRSEDEVLTDAHLVFGQLIELTQAQSETFLTEPQRFAGVPEPVLIWMELDHVCEHYRGHMQAIRSGLDSFN